MIMLEVGARWHESENEVESETDAEGIEENDKRK
jgi:hypothetical protein